MSEPSQYIYLVDEAAPGSADYSARVMIAVYPDGKLEMVDWMVWRGSAYLRMDPKVVKQ